MTPRSTSSSSAGSHCSAGASPGRSRVPRCFWPATAQATSIGAICHTINPRLFHDQLDYIVNHAEDAAICFDLSFAPLVEKLASHWRPVKYFVAMTDRAHMPAIAVKNLLCYEELIAAETPDL